MHWYKRRADGIVKARQATVRLSVTQQRHDKAVLHFTKILIDMLGKGVAGDKHEHEQERVFVGHGVGWRIGAMDFNRCGSIINADLTI